MTICRAVSVLLSSGVVLLAATICAADDPEHEWPAEIRTEGAVVWVYQPQLDSLERDLLKGRAAVSVQMNDAEAPVFGAAWIESRIDTDLDTRRVTFRELDVARVRFPNATATQEEQLAALITEEMPGWNIDMSLDRLMAALEVADRKTSTAEGFNDAPPVILFSQEPRVLVAIIRLRVFRTNRRVPPTTTSSRLFLV